MRFNDSAQRAAQVGVEELFERVVPRVNRVEREQRIDDPVASVRAPTAVSVSSRIDSSEPLARAVGRGNQLEMPPRGLIHHHVLGDSVEARRRDMREVAAEGFFDVEQRDSRRVRDRFAQLGRSAREPIRERRSRSVGAEAIRDRASSEDSSDP